MAWILLAIGLVFIVEGLAYALAPSMVERLLEILRSLPIEARRQIGALACVTGLILTYLAFYLGLN
ncbi:MAG: DUF2065 domain-containing protein [Pseudomonadota bacterium]